MSITAVWDTAESIMAAVVDIFADNSVTLPARQYIHIGEISYDCATLAVQLGPLRAGGADSPQIATVRPSTVLRRSAEFLVVLVRECFPVGTMRRPPAASTIHAVVEDLAIDGWLLFEQMQIRAARKEILPSCKHVVLGPCIPVTPQGQIAGWKMTVAIELS